VRAYEIFNEAGLSTKGLMDNPDRLEKFIARMDRSDGKGGKFLTIDGSTVVIDNVPEIVNNLRNGEWHTKVKGRQSIAFPINNSWSKAIKNDDGTIEDDSEVEYILLSKLQKTKEFGSSEGVATKAEDWALNHLNKTFTELKGDKKEIPVVIGDRTVQVSEFISTPKSCSGDCKSDWSAVDANGNDVAWISHKKIENSKKGKEGHSHGADFHGWGGMSDRVMKDVYNDIPEIKQEILDFSNDVLKAYPTDGEKSKLPKGVWLFRKIKTGILRGISVYGPAFRGKDSARGLQNVDLILQGTPSFDGNTLVADIHHSNGDRAEDGYEPYLTARYNPSRNSDIQGISFKGMRFSIYAKAGIVQRKGYSDEIQTVKKI
jgi:hypothetical protein|tara:strand:- start:217 stop:1338 length:1122 start_codon:yes stop_codon:yes gene_type:complete